jgi:hypothetical protein
VAPLQSNNITHENDTQGRRRMGATLTRMQTEREKEKRRRTQRWKLDVPVLCLEYKGYNREGQISFRDVYCTNGVDYWLGEPTVATMSKVPTRIPYLIRLYPSVRSWHVDTEGFPAVLSRYSTRMTRLETIADSTRIYLPQQGSTLSDLIARYADEPMEPVVISVYVGGN